MLENEDGELVEDENRIQMIVTTFMADLFKKQEDNEERREKRRRVLELLDKQVSGEDNAKLIQDPTRGEIEGLVENMAKGKASGLDGLTSEVPYDGRRTNPVLKKLRCSTLMTLKEGNGRWTNITQLARRRGIDLSQEDRTEVMRLQTWIDGVKLYTVKLEDSPSWRWSGEPDKWGGWKRPTKFWTKLLEGRKEDPATPGKQWGTDTTAAFWKPIWTKLGKCKTSPHIKLWVWKILHQGFFTGERALKMKVSDGVCNRCQRAEETTPHMFRHCTEVTPTWAQWSRALSSTSTTRAEEYELELLRLMISSLEVHNKDPAKLHLLAAITMNIWKDRNQAVFNHKRTRTPLQGSILEGMRTIKADMKPRGGDENWRRGLTGLSTLRNWLNAHLEARNPSTEYIAVDTPTAEDAVIPINTQRSDRTTRLDATLSREANE
ncbi:hypothetical protein R1sor_012506 [Riccia sorocarpa]|uniref:Reverse transcriptase zinc-binding domain-containing protein n=1 Tax=Riccia sorocarpa TaxID=122646 RepID=A0ABD3I3Y9_9MARC